MEQCPYLRNNDEELQYRGTDVGSDWITFAVVATGVATGTFCILNNLAALINKAIALKSNKKVLDMQEETYKAMKMKNEITRETIDAYKGVEIYSSIETPKEIKVLFLFSDTQQTLPDNLIKYLEDKVITEKTELQHFLRKQYEDIIPI